MSSEKIGGFDVEWKIRVERNGLYQELVGLRGFAGPKSMDEQIADAQKRLADCLRDLAAGDGLPIRSKE